MGFAVPCRMRARFARRCRTALRNLRSSPPPARSVRCRPCSPTPSTLHRSGRRSRWSCGLVQQSSPHAFRPHSPPSLRLFPSPHLLPTLRTRLSSSDRPIPFCFLQNGGTSVSARSLDSWSSSVPREFRGFLGSSPVPREFLGSSGVPRVPREFSGSSGVPRFLGSSGVPRVPREFSGSSGVPRFRGFLASESWRPSSAVGAS
jgi:hypothetical protein